MKKIDIETWVRKEHFDFFKSFDEPLYGICADVCTTKTYMNAKEKGESFYLRYLHAILKTINSIENFRYRLIDNEVYLVDVINPTATVLREDETFGYSFWEFSEDFDVFKERFQIESQRVKSGKGLCFGPNAVRDDVIHFSAIPWIKFTSLSHVSSVTQKDSVPKVSVGKMYEKDGELYLPVSVHAFHGFVDGIHMGKFFTKLEEHLNS